MINYDLLNVLIALGIALSVILMLLSIYFAIILRKINILATKVDYLVEDATYKLEKMSIVVDALVKFSGYVDVLEKYLNQSADKFIDFITKNRIEMDAK